jgi:hypothetical protein
VNLEKPKIRTLTVEADVRLGRAVIIQALTSEASSEIERMLKNASEFGNVARSRSDWRLILFVDERYHVDEVVSYLRDLSDAQQWPEEIEEIEAEK